MTSKKESQFTTVTSFSSGDLVTGLNSSQNVNFSYDALFNAFSGLDNLNNIGEALAVPILVQPVAGENNFRMLESSKGIIASVSASDGINLACNFTQAASGIKLINNLSADAYNFKTLVAGSNIALLDDGESVSISFAGSETSSKTVVVSQESDFPDAIGGVITLDNNTDYLIVDDITTANRFMTGNPTTIRAASSQMVQLTYSGPDAMFTGIDPSVKFINITISCPNGDVFDMTSTGAPSTVQMVESNVQECETLGTISGAFITRFTAVAFENVKTNGLTLTGEQQIFIIDTAVAFLGAGVLVDFADSEFQSISVSNLTVPVSASGTYILSGLADSGNIVVGGIATVTNNKIFGDAETIQNISINDVRWEFFFNNAIQDSLSDGLIHITGSAIDTAISVIDTPVIVDNVDWTISEVSRFTHNGAGRLTYIGEKNFKGPIDLTVTLLASAGGDKQLSSYIAINGVVIEATGQQVTASSSKASASAAIWQHNFEPNDYIEVFVENNSGTDDIIVQQAVLRVN